MAKSTNTDALHQGNEPTEGTEQRLSLPARAGPELPVEQRGPLLGRSAQCSSAAALCTGDPLLETARLCQKPRLWIIFHVALTVSNFRY